jgi:hypothetical protein
MPSPSLSMAPAPNLGFIPNVRMPVFTLPDRRNWPSSPLPPIAFPRPQPIAAGPGSFLDNFGNGIRNATKGLTQLPLFRPLNS